MRASAARPSLDLGDQLEVRALAHRPRDPLAKQRMVIGHQHRDASLAHRPLLPPPRVAIDRGGRPSIEGPASHPIARRSHDRAAGRGRAMLRRARRDRPQESRPMLTTATIHHHATRDPRRPWPGPRRPTRLRVIVADDHPLYRQGIVRALESTGGPSRSSHQASDGATALALIRRHEPDVAVLDVRMPGMDGIDVVAALARYGPRRPRRAALGLRRRAARRGRARSRRGRLHQQDAPTATRSSARTSPTAARRARGPLAERRSTAPPISAAAAPRDGRRG